VNENGTLREQALSPTSLNSSLRTYADMDGDLRDDFVVLDRSAATLRRSVDGAALDLGEGIVTRSASVTAEDAGTADLTVQPAIGGGLRRVLFVNPDGQTAAADVELRSVNAGFDRARLSDTVAPARDVLCVKGTISRNDLSPNDSFTGRPQGLELRFGDANKPYVLRLDADDPRWKEKRGGRILVFKTEPAQFPRVRLVVDSRKERFQLRVSFFGFPTNPQDGATAMLAYTSAEDLGRTTATWTARTRQLRTRLRLR